MKKFTFSLEKILEYKIQVEDNLKGEHAQIIQSILKEEKALSALEADYHAQGEKLTEEKRNGCTVNTIYMYDSYMKSLTQKIKRQEQVIYALKMRERKKLEEVVEAKKETDTIDKLKEKKLTEYGTQVRKAEEEFIEEFVSNQNLQVKI